MKENKQDPLEGLGPKTPSWFRRHKKLAIFLSILAVLVVGGGVVTGLYFLNKKVDIVPNLFTPQEPAPEPVKYYSPLTGNELKRESSITMPVTAVMIENSPDSRPQSGLKESGVVFEAIAEGGITRFLVLYQQEKPKLVGPVRSVRSYYLSWVKPFHASIAHIGGSSAALKQVRSGAYRDIDQFFNAQAYWRATDRYAPHNVYTSFKNLDALNAAKGYKTSKFKGFTRKDSVAAEKPTATKINVTISSALFNSSYKYNPKTNTYDRSQAGAPHKDREKGQISPRVVVVLKTKVGLIFQDGNRQEITTLGKGTAYIFQNGKVAKVTWNKKNRDTQITFTDAKGNDVPLARGQTWITVVPSDTGGVTWR